MLELRFEPFRTEIRAGKLDLSRIMTGPPDEEYVVIRTGEPGVFYLADIRKIETIAKPILDEKDTPNGRKKIRVFFSSLRNVTAETLGEALCGLMREAGGVIPVTVEPMRNSVKLTAGEPEKTRGTTAEKE